MAHAGLTRLRARSCVHDSEGPRQRARSFCFAARTRSDAKMLRDGFDTGAQSTLGSRRAEYKYRLQGDSAVAEAFGSLRKFDFGNGNELRKQFGG